VALESHQPRPHSAYLSLVDMAGSERATKTGNDNVRRAEAKLINESLLVWRRCIRSLHQNQTSSRSSTKVKVPYNESMLTKCVKNFFEGDGQMVVITCVSPASKGERENHETLKFSSYFSDITTASSTIPPPQPRRPRPRTTTTNNVKYQQLQTLEEETEEQPVMKSTRPARITQKQHHLQQSQPVPSTPLTMDEFESRLVTAAQSLHSVELDYEQLKKESDSIQHVFEQKQTELLHVEQETQKLRKEQEDYFETQEEWRIRSDTSRALLVKEIDDYEILEEEREKLQVEVSEMYATNSNLKIQQRTKVTGLMESKQKLTQLQEEQDSAESEMRSTNIATAEDYERRRVELEELTEYEVEEIERAIEDEHIKTKKLSAIISAVRSILNNDQQAKNKQKLHMLEESMAELGVTFDDDDHDVSFEGLQQSLMQSGFGRSYVENESNVTADASESMSTSAINLDISTHETDKSLLLDIANNDDENFKENSRPCTHSSDNHAHKKKKAKILDQMSHSFKDPGGDFTYNRAKKQVSTPKVKDLFKGKKVMVDEVRVHTQQDCSEHTIVAGKVSKSITGNGASVTFYGLESKTLDPNMSILDRRKRRRDRTNK